MIEFPPPWSFKVQLTVVFVAPVTVAVNTANPATGMEGFCGEIETEMFDWAATFSVTPADVTAPGSGFFTVTVTLPIWLLEAVPVAFSCVDETRVVVSAVEPKFTVALGAKCDPFTVMLNEPTDTAAGLIEEISGAGFKSVTLMLAVFVLSAFIVAPMVTVFGEVGNSGAVKSPLELIVPVVGLPPATPLTAQNTEAVAVSPTTCA